MKLYMIILGCKPKGRFTEQHDIFFGIGESLAALVPQMKASWPEAKGLIHIDSWREVTVVDNFSIEVIPNESLEPISEQLFFLNLGGYKENEMEEYHYKMLAVSTTMAAAIKKAKGSTFYKHCGFKGATSHIDDKYGIDVDDIYNVKDILPFDLKANYSLKITPSEVELTEDELHVGYLKIAKLV